MTKIKVLSTAAITLAITLTAVAGFFIYPEAVRDTLQTPLLDMRFWHLALIAGLAALIRRRG